MSDDASHDGGCRCGQIRFRLTGNPLVTMACHCRGCQRMTASAYSLSAFYPAAQFELVSGEPVVGGLHGATQHMFCPYCMSWLYTKPEGLNDFVNVRTPMLDTPPAAPPFIETMVSEAFSWARLNATHSFVGFPSREKFPELIGAYIASSGGAF